MAFWMMLIELLSTLFDLLSMLGGSGLGPLS